MQKLEPDAKDFFRQSMCDTSTAIYLLLADLFLLWFATLSCQQSV